MPECFGAPAQPLGRLLELGIARHPDGVGTVRVLGVVEQGGLAKVAVGAQPDGSLGQAPAQTRYYRAQQRQQLPDPTNVARPQA